MTDEEFELVLMGFTDAAYQDGIESIAHYSREKKQQVLEAALVRLHIQQDDFTYLVNRLAGELLREGTPVSDDVIIGVVQTEATFQNPFPFLNFPMAEFIDWVEHMEANGGMSVRLLTCLRKNLPWMSQVGADRAHRTLMKRMSAALKLIDRAVIHEVRDAWTAVALAKRESLPPGSQKTWDSLLELADRQKASKPSKVYLRQAETIVSRLPEFPEIMREILEATGRDGPVGVRFRGSPSERKNLLDDDFIELLRALIWLCIPFRELKPHLHGAGERCAAKIKRVGPLSSKIAAACAYVLRKQENASSAKSPFGIQKTIRKKSTQETPWKTITEVRAHFDPAKDIIEERLVPDLGFTASDRPSRKLGDHIVTLCVSPAGLPVLLLDDGAASSSSKPRLPKTEEAKALQRELRKTWKQEALRLERMMSSECHLPCETWRELYLAHPIVGLLSRRLLWRAGETLVGFELPDHASSLVTIDGSRLSLAGDERIQLWHPCDLDEEERHAWERWVLDRRLIQPFPQALRPVYGPEPGTEEWGEDGQFEGHAIHQGTFAALRRQRGWHHNFHRMNKHYEPSLEFPEHGIWAALQVQEFTQTLASGYLQVWLQIQCLRFYRGGRIESMPLEDVPPVVFSETMRDIDWFVSASKAASPTWRDSIPDDERDG